MFPRARANVYSDSLFSLQSIKGLTAALDSHVCWIRLIWICSAEQSPSLLSLLHGACVNTSDESQSDRRRVQNQWESAPHEKNSHGWRLTNRIRLLSLEIQYEDSCEKNYTILLCGVLYSCSALQSFWNGCQWRKGFTLLNKPLLRGNSLSFNESTAHHVCS